MKPETLSKMLTLIANANERELELLNDQIRNRYRTMRNLQARHALRTLQVGDQVRLTGLKPKYINGARGTIRGLRQTKFEVLLDDGQYTGRFSRLVTVPATCLQKIETD
jgi:predicted RNA-binding protein with PUA-like domain